MGYFSELAAENMHRYNYDRERPVFNRIRRNDMPKIEHLEFYRNYLENKLAELEEERPRDPLHPDYDRMTYARSRCHYYEEPETAQEILRAIDEVEDLIWAESFRTEKNRIEIVKKEQEKDLSQALEGQMLMPEYWDGAAIFKDAQQYASVLPILSVCA